MLQYIWWYSGETCMWISWQSRMRHAPTLAEFRFALISARILCVACTADRWIFTSSCGKEGRTKAIKLPPLPTLHQSSPQHPTIEWYKGSARPSKIGRRMFHRYQWDCNPVNGGGGWRGGVVGYTTIKFNCMGTSDVGDIYFLLASTFKEIYIIRSKGFIINMKDILGQTEGYYSTI